MSNKENTAPEKTDENESGVFGFLAVKDIAYTKLPHEYCRSIREVSDITQISADNIARTVLLKDKSGIIMAVLPASYMLDFAELCRNLNRELEPLTEQEIINEVLIDKSHTFCPPVPEMFKLKGVIDSRLFELDEVYLEAGTGVSLVRLDKQNFQQLHSNTWEGSFSEPASKLSSLDDKDNHQSVQNMVKKFTPLRIKERVEETFELPVIPPMADELLKLRVDPNADAYALSRLVEKDPSLSAQLVSWACSPYYGYPGKITSVDDAIIKVLGYDLVMNISLGIAIGQMMRVPVEGPLGLKCFWRHSVYSAALTERILRYIPHNKKPYRGLAYLCGLLHNIGHLLLGQVFPPQFYLLNRFVELNEHLSISKIENYVLGTEHQQIGAWLMHAWHMPEELVTAVRWHHYEEYDAENAVYSSIVLLVNRLLRQKGIGDDIETELPEKILESLSISKEDCAEALNEFWDDKEGLEQMIKLLSS